MSLTLKLIEGFFYFYNQNEYFAFLTDNIFNVTIDDEEEDNLKNYPKSNDNKYVEVELKQRNNNYNNSKNNNNHNYNRINESSRSLDISTVSLKSNKLENIPHKDLVPIPIIPSVYYPKKITNISKTSYNNNFNKANNNSNSPSNEIENLDSINKENENKIQYFLNKSDNTNIINISQNKANKYTNNGNNNQYNINEQRKSILINEVHINKEFNEIIEYKKKKRVKVELGRCERFIFNYLWCNFCEKTKDISKIIKYELISAVNYEIDKKLDLIELVKHMDQFRLFKKLFLNESQCFMLNSRDKMTITNHYRKNYNDKEVVKFLNQEKLQRKKEKLIEYLKQKGQENIMSPIDLILIKYLDEEFQDEIQKIENKF